MPDQAPAAESLDSVSAQSAPPPPPNNVDRERQTFRTITVSSGGRAAPQSDTVMVRVYHLPNGRKVTQYSNVPPAAGAVRTSQTGSATRVFIVPVDNAADAYAYAPR
jgi:hypothetical protein